MPEHQLNELPAPPEILLVDDDAALRGLLTVLLSQMGMRYHSARNGVEALEVLQAEGQNRFHALVTDIRMPEMGGIELGRHVRKQFPAMPILYISGFAPSMKEVENELDEHSDFLRKPFSFTSFSEKLRALLARSSPSAQSVNPDPTATDPLPRKSSRKA